MKHLNDYMKEKQTAAFNKFGAFFAFSDKQFKERQKDGVKYTSMGAGMIAPTSNVANLHQALNTIRLDAIKQDIAENGIKAIIHREFGNYVCQLGIDYTDAVDALAGYGITDKQFSIEWSEYYQKCIDNNWF